MTSIGFKRFTARGECATDRCMSRHEESQRQKRSRPDLGRSRNKNLSKGSQDVRSPWHTLKGGAQTRGPSKMSPSTVVDAEAHKGPGWWWPKARNLTTDTHSKLSTEHTEIEPGLLALKATSSTLPSGKSFWKVTSSRGVRKPVMPQWRRRLSPAIGSLGFGCGQVTCIDLSQKMRLPDCPPNAKIAKHLRSVLTSLKHCRLQLLVSQCLRQPMPVHV